MTVASQQAKCSGGMGELKGRAMRILQHSTTKTYLNLSVFALSLSKHGVSACATALNSSVNSFSPYPSKMQTITGPADLGRASCSFSLYSSDMLRNLAGQRSNMLGRISPGIYETARKETQYFSPKKYQRPHNLRQLYSRHAAGFALVAAVPWRWCDAAWTCIAPLRSHGRDNLACIDITHGNALV